ncbi:MAG: hypothetical protein JXR80_05680 [Deltaproteobacteria bacterium]|nr:hypothetical protein [Deltaproteobacteria bacterium]
MYFIYNSLLWVVLLLFWPGLLWYMRRRQGSLEGLGERLGYGWPQASGKVGPRQRTTWFHGASLGEMQMLAPLLRAWRDAYPESELLLTTMTLTGRQVARRLFPEARVLLLPLDLPHLWWLFFRRFQPLCLIVAETELWPNLLRCARRRGLPVALVNARLSVRSFANYRFFGFFTRSMFATPVLVAVQDAVSGERFAALGTAAERIVLSGNMKFDLLPPVADQLLYRQLFAPELQVVVAGSTHAGEEEMLLAAWEKGADAAPEIFKSACLVLAPRHPQRFAEVAQLLTGKKVDFLSFSSFKKTPAPLTLPAAPAVLLLDTLGDLIHFYNLASFAVIGGTLVPGVGGHNPLEAAVFGKAVVHGTYTANFKAGFTYLDEEGGGVSVADPEALAAVVIRALREPGWLGDAGRKAAAAVTRQRGALQRTMLSLQQALALWPEDKH